MSGEERKFDFAFLKNKFSMPKPGDGVFMEWRGTYRITAEGIDALLEYGHTRVVVGAKEQRIAIQGDALEMRFLSQSCIVIEGCITHVCYLSDQQE